MPVAYSHRRLALPHKACLHVLYCTCAFYMMAVVDCDRKVGHTHNHAATHRLAETKWNSSPLKCNQCTRLPARFFLSYGFLYSLLFRTPAQTSSRIKQPSLGCFCAYDGMIDAEFELLNLCLAFLNLGLFLVLTFCEFILCLKQRDVVLVLWYMLSYSYFRIMSASVCYFWIRVCWPCGCVVDSSSAGHRAEVRKPLQSLSNQKKDHVQQSFYQRLRFVKLLSFKITSS